MKKKKTIILSIALMLVIVMSTSGCVMPGTDFDTVKIVATVTRNGGDYTLTPSGESGYELHVVVGTLSIEALGLDIDTQAMKTMYDNAQDNNKVINRHLFGDGVTGWFKGWWNRAKGGLHFNTVSDLAWADGGGLLGFELPVFDKLGTVNYAGGMQDVFNVDTSGDYTLPNFGLGIYSSTIPSTCFKNGVEPGYLVMNDYEKGDFNGVRVEGDTSGRNTGFVVYDGSNYHIIVLTNSPAFATDTPEVITASVTLIKPDVPDLEAADTWMTSTTDYFKVYGDGMKRKLESGTVQLVANAETAIAAALATAMNAIPGSKLVKSFDSVANFFTEGEPPTFTEDLEQSIFMENLHLIFNEKNIYKNAWNKFKNQVNGVEWKPTGFDWITINVDDGIGPKEWDGIKVIYFGHKNWWILPDVDSLYTTSERNQIYTAMDQDIINFYNQYDLDNFYRTWSESDNRANFEGPLFAVQLVDDSFLSIWDGGAIPAVRDLLDLDWDDPLSALNITDWDSWRNDLVTDISAQIVIPDYISESLVGFEEMLTNQSEIIELLNDRVLKFELQLSKLSNYLTRVIPETPKVSIFAYQVPSPVFTKIIGDTGDFIQADPTSIFSAAIIVSIGDTTNWSLVTDYPRAIVQTQSHGTLTIPLQLDTTTDTYILRQDMVGVENLSVGDTVKTYFEVKVTNTTGEQNLTSHTLTYYTRVVKSWLSEALDRLGITIDGVTADIEDIKQAINWLGYDDEPFFGGNNSALDPHYAILTVRNEDGEELYVKNPRKNFKMQQNDSQTLVWEVRIFENEPYTISITVGNNTHDSIVDYDTSINKGEVALYNPLGWSERIGRWWENR